MMSNLGKKTIEHYSQYDLKEKMAQKIIEIFLIRYFGETRDVVDFEKNFIAEHDLQAPTIDYFKLNRFITSAINNLRELDHSLISGTLGKLYADVESLFEFYAKFESRTRIASVVFEVEFLMSIPEFKYLKSELEDAERSKRQNEASMASLDKKLQGLSNLDSSEFKKTRGAMADTLHSLETAKEKVTLIKSKIDVYVDHLKPRFIEVFEKEKEEHRVALQQVINTKSVYLDHLLWHQAEKSMPIQRFFKKSDIKGDYDTKTYIEYYMRNINIEQSKDVGWHKYLKDIIKLFDGQ
jgi:hypothetical protein